MRVRVPQALAVLTVAAFTALGATANAIAASAPSIGPEWASAIKSNDAFVEGLVNPRSEERGAYYQFQLAKNPSEFANEFTCPTEGFPAGSSFCNPPPSQPGALPIRSTSYGTYSQSVNIDLKSAGASLEPGTTYYFRVIAARIVPTEDTTQWEEPTVFGATQSFTTSATEAPSIEEISVSNVTQTDATLEGKINPDGPATTYRFHLASPPCGAIKTCEQNSFPLPSGNLPAGTTTQTVSLDLNSASVTLTPGDWYEYWVTASNSAGEAGSQYDANVFMAAEEEIPLVTSEGVSQLTATDATLEAAINPRAEAGAYYQFQLVTDPGEYASEILCPPTLQPGTTGCVGPQGTALPIGWVPGNLENPLAAQPVHLDLAAAGVTLKPGVTYHFRLLAARRVPTEDTIQWEEPTVFGADQTFTTLSPPLSGTEPPHACAFSAASCQGGELQPPRSICRRGHFSRHRRCLKWQPAHHRHHHRNHRRRAHRPGPPRASNPA
jgi:hypothetical protein